MADSVDLRRVDAAGVQQMLRRLNPNVAVRRVEVLERSNCGDGVASTADRILLAVEFEPGRDGGLPSRMILKTLLLHPWLRFGLPAVLSLAGVSRAAEALPLVGRGARSALFVGVGLYQRFFPHAPDPMYVNEVRFYTELRPELQIEAPRAFGGLFDEKNRHFGILMEDLALREATFPNATVDVAVDSIRDLLANLARLHAGFWESPRLSSELAWLPDRLSGGMFPVFDGIGRELIRYQVEQHAAKSERLAPLGRSVDQLWEDLWASQRALAEGPCTLLHGDTHVGNTYLLPDGSGGFLDFQLSVRGHWANDVTYLLVTGLSPESRRKHERDLLGFYLEELHRHGVDPPPTAEDAWQAYRLAVIWGLVIGWLITPPINYGAEITDANISRLVTACQDLEAFEALG
ncbi:MAG: phosphotransferase [Deltaproteobacteria bacterium]|nr:phosphotransferase [Deltaproteobacteria bacterium]